MNALFNNFPFSSSIVRSKTANIPVNIETKLCAWRHNIPPPPAS